MANEDPQIAIDPKTTPVKVLIDTETTDLPKGRNFTGVRLIQIAYLLLNNNNEILTTKMYYIKPDGFSIPNSWLHGITTEIASEKGRDIRDVLTELQSDLQKCEMLICHNVDFDKNVLLAESNRYNFPEGVNRFQELSRKLTEIQTYCTMIKGGEKYLGGRWIKLSLLHEKIYPEVKWEQKHDALDDAMHSYGCYLKLVKPDEIKEVPVSSEKQESSTPRVSTPCVSKPVKRKITLRKVILTSHT